MEYTKQRYLYPPRPEKKGPVASIPMYHEMGYMAQPKLNGSCSTIYLDGTSAKIMNRHNDTFTNKTIPINDMLDLHRGTGYMVLVGELMNKSKKDMHRKTFNGLVIFDLLVANGEYLIGSTFTERQEILKKLYPGVPFDPFINKIGNNTYMVNNFSDYLPLWNELTSIDMYEGWVFKKPGGILKPGYHGTNNTDWQAKCRKPTKNYRW